MGFGADFLGGFSQGVNNGLGLYGQLQAMAMNQQQMQLRAQMEERRQQMLEEQAGQNRAQSLIGAAKIKNPAVRENVFSMLGLDPSMAASVGADDEGFNKDFQAWATQMGSTPEGARVFTQIMQEDPARAAEGILSMRRIQSGQELAGERMDMANQRMELARQQFMLSNDRFAQLQMMQHLRATGQIPPMGYQFDPSAGGGAGGASLAPIPGGPAMMPTNEERSSAGFLSNAQAAEQNALAWQQQNPDYLGSTSSQIDRLLQSEKFPAGAGAVVGGALGSLTRSPWGIMAGAGAGGSAGLGFQEAVEEMFTSEKGRAFKAAWSPFLSTVVYGRSGKAVTATEWARAFKEMIPMPNDDENTLAVKAQNRQDAIQSLASQAGRAPVPGAGGFGAPGGNAASAAPALRTLSPSAEQELTALTARYTSGAASPAEVEKLKGYLRAKGITWRE